MAPCAGVIPRRRGAFDPCGAAVACLVEVPHHPDVAALREEAVEEHPAPVG